jgi:hypothetical protein
MCIRTTEVAAEWGVTFRVVIQVVKVPVQSVVTVRTVSFKSVVWRECQRFTFYGQPPKQSRRKPNPS